MIKLVTSKPNGIHLREFAIITHLAYLWSQGFPIPPTLPDSLLHSPVFRYASDEYDDAEFSVPPAASLYQDFTTGQFREKFKVVPEQRPDGMEKKELRRGEISVSTINELGTLREPTGLYLPLRSLPVGDSFVLQGLQNLRRIIISNSVGRQVTTFRLSQLPQLESLIIGEDCFTQSERSDVGNPSTQRDRVMRVRASFVVEKCPLLTEIVIGNNSFSDYPLFRIADCDLLYTLRVGTADVKDVYNNRGYGFYSCNDLELTSRFM